jgi:hypothetical protein
MGELSVDDVHCLNVSMTNSATCGQARGCREEQKTTPIEGDVVEEGAEDMAS